METNGNNKSQIKLVVAIVVATIWIIGCYVKIHNLNDQILTLNNTIDEYQYAVQTANNTIDDANSMIEDAKGYSWSSYDEMGTALDSLESIDNVSQP